MWSGGDHGTGGQSIRYQILILFFFWGAIPRSAMYPATLSSSTVSATLSLRALPHYPILLEFWWTRQKMEEAKVNMTTPNTHQKSEHS